MTFWSTSLRTAVGAAACPDHCSAIWSSPDNCRNAGRSPDAALLTSCFTAASSLVTILRWPFSLMTTFSLKVFVMTVARFSVPSAGRWDCPIGLA